MIKYICICLVFVNVVISSQLPSVRFVYPEKDSVYYKYDKYRICGSADTNSAVFIDAEKVNIYTSGAFVKLVDTKKNVNSFLITEVVNGVSYYKRIYIINEALKPVMPDSGDIILNASVSPSAGIWYRPGDNIEFSFIGKTGILASVKDFGSFREFGIDGKVSEYKLSYKVSGTERFLEHKANLILEYDGIRKTIEIPGKITVLPKNFTMKGVTQGFRPYFTYDRNYNRLGARNANYVNDGIEVELTDKPDNMYKVNLGCGKTGWINEKFIKVKDIIDVAEILRLSSEEKSLKSNYDTLKIRLQEKSLYSISENTEKLTITIDIYSSGVSPVLSKGENLTEIDKAGVSKSKSGCYTLSISLQSEKFWGMHTFFSENTLFVLIKRRPSNYSLEGKKIIIDPGHGGEFKGAVGATGLLEKDINLQVAYKLKNLLEAKGALPVLTRYNDVFLTNQERVKLAIDKEADFLLSIHANSVGLNVDPLKGKGTAVYYKFNSNKTLGSSIHSEMLSLGFSSFGMHGNFNFYMNSITEVPNILVEMAFISNPEDEIKLMDPAFQESIAEKITSGLENYLKASDLGN